MTSVIIYNRYLVTSARVHELLDYNGSTVRYVVFQLGLRRSCYRYNALIVILEGLQMQYYNTCMHNCSILLLFTCELLNNELRYVYHQVV